MTRPAIRVERLGKRYTLTRARDTARYRTLRESVAGGVATLARRVRGAAGVDAARVFWALRDVSFDVLPGDVVGIVGRNGAGKSTLLKVLSRITKPTAGRVVLNGRVGSLLEVGTGFHPELTGRENVFLNGSILGMTRREVARKFDEIVAFAEVEQFLDTPVKRYSSGMYVRLAFAVAAHLEPEILIVDEVLAVGDAGFQKKCLGKMNEVSRAGRTVLVVSHNTAVLSSLCTTGVVLDRGRVQTTGPIAHCLRTYAGGVLAGSPAVVEFPRDPAKPSQLVRIELLGDDGRQTSQFEYGDRLVVRAAFAADVPTQTPRLGLVVSAETGERVLNANMHYLPSTGPARPTRAGAITCDLGVVPFMAGRYLVSFWFGTHGREHEVLPDAIGFEVAEQDAWGLGRLPPANASPLWWPAAFSVDAGDDAHGA
jgi:lipopolysaccharide transport system ATP-binding protein